MNQPAAEKAAQEHRLKRRFDSADRSDTSSSLGEDIDSDGIDSLGYMPTHILYGLTAQDEVRFVLPAKFR